MIVNQLASFLIAVGAVVLFCSSNIRADLIAYEGFDYATNTSIAAQAGGSGWTNAWASGTGQGLATNVSESLSYADVNGRLLQTSGGSLVVGNPVGTSSTTANPNRGMDSNLSGGLGTVPGVGQTRWISFLFKRIDSVSNPGFRQANMGLFESSGERAAVGAPNTNPTNYHLLSLWGNGVHNSVASFQAQDYPISPGTTYFILLKTVCDGTAAPDLVYAWFNWTNLLVEPDVSTASLTNNEVNLSGVNTIRFQAGNANAIGNNAVFQADEIRVGTTFTNVTPNLVSGSAPMIVSQPANQSAVVGETVQFNVSVAGSTPIFYQWYYNANTYLTDETNATLSLTNLQIAQAGSYHVVVSNVIGSTNSLSATLTVSPPAPPEVVSGPTSRAVVDGYTTSLSVVATGYAPLSYQWRLNGVSLPGRTNSGLTIASAQSSDGGDYSVIVTNIAGAVTSAPASLTVIYIGPQGLPAFPGADGSAQFASGGRGGLVYHVTKLDRNFNHSEPGTLRYGLTDANFPVGVPRTIVFDVAGTFWLGRFGAESNHTHGWDTSSRYNVSSHTTVAGQTAPGPVIIAGGLTKPGGVNIVMRNVTFAPSYGTRNFQEDFSVSPTPGDFPDSYLFDALDISGQNIMLDHLTCLFGTDETISCNELAATLTIQYCTMAQGENYPQADAENPGVYSGHALGSLLQAGSNAKVSVIHNLYAHLANRLPRVGSEVGTGALNDFRNNVFYNWFSTAGSGASGQPSYNNFINNFYLAGAGGDSTSGSNIVNAAGGVGIFNGASSSATRAFVGGNLKDTNKDSDANDAVSANGDYGSITAAASAYDINIGVTLAGATGFTNTLRYTGARWWERDYDLASNNTNAIDSIDERLIHETATGGGKIKAWADDPFDDNPNEGLEWKAILALRADTNTFAAPYNHPLGWDADNDGMPDTWEIACGLNPNLANNNGDYDSDGFTDLEEYMNELAAWPAPGEVVFTGNTNNRFASIFNWSVTGVSLTISGLGTQVTRSLWQPSRFDTAVVHGQTAVVDAVGQSAGNLRIEAGGTLDITGGWLNVSSNVLVLEPSCSLIVSSVGTLRVTNDLVNNGKLVLQGAASLLVGGALTNNGTLDALTWNGTLPSGLVNNGALITRSDLRISNAYPSGANFIVQTTGYPGHNYQLEFLDELGGGVWQSVGSVLPGNGGTLNLVHNGGANAPKRYYRVAVSP